MVAPGVIGGGVDVHVADCIQLVELIVALFQRVAAIGAARAARRRWFGAGRRGLFAVMRLELVGSDGNVAAHRFGVAVGGYDLRLLVPLNALARIDLDRQRRTVLLA